MTTSTAPSLLLSVVDEDEDFDPNCLCPDGMPCCCMAESRDPMEW
jgi:hypothetical protein